MFTIPPLTLPATFNPQNNNTQRQPIVGVQIQNNSATPCIVYSGGVIEDYIQASGSYLVTYPLPTLSPPTIQVEPIGSSTGSINVTVYQKGDPLPNVVTGSAPTQLSVVGPVDIQNVQGSVILTTTKSPPALGNTPVNQGSGLLSPTISNDSFSEPLSSTSAGAPGNILIALWVIQSANPGTYTCTPPSGYGLINADTGLQGTVSRTATVESSIAWLWYGILSGSVITADWTFTIPSGVTSVSLFNAFFADGSGSNAQFSNAPLTGAQGALTSWSSTDASNPNLNLATPGIMAMSICNYQSTTFSLGSAYANAASSDPALWIASSQTGELQVYVNQNPETATTVVGEAGLIIPQ